MLHLLACSGGGAAGDEGSIGCRRRGVGERGQQSHQAALLADWWSMVPLSSSSEQVPAKMYFSYSLGRSSAKEDAEEKNHAEIDFGGHAMELEQSKMTWHLKLSCS